MSETRPARTADIAALCNVGCVAAEPFFHPVLPAPRKPPAPPPCYCGRSLTRCGSPRRARYIADADGLILARAEHADRLVKAGCAPA